MSSMPFHSRSWSWNILSRNSQIVTLLNLACKKIAMRTRAQIASVKMKNPSRER
jgi:hypothetical protein